MFSIRILKIIAVFLLINFISGVIAPPISYALTSGPTAPEATSFEPVDTTDLVDLKTGDFTYNIPLLEVPGPAGGYPLSLAYHAGIQPDQEASWAGLGWIISPGSISRLVNGYPDDHNNVTNVDRSFWEGRETETYTVGLSVGIANVATVSAGMSFAQDTYRGYGEGMYAGIGLGYSINSVGLSANVTYGVAPYGGAYTSVGLTVGVSTGSQSAMNLSANVGLSVNSNSGLNAGAGAGVGVGRMSLLDASISTNSSKPSLATGGGVIGIFNGKSNNVSTNSESFQIDIPIYYGVNLRLGRDYQRYWIDESVGIHTFGSLYSSHAQPNFASAFDTYELLDINLNIADHDKAEKVLGGSFPDVDHYTVTAQGVSGNIRPYHFQQHLYRQDQRDESNKILSKSYILDPNAEGKQVEFRFINDFSNRFEYNPGDFNTETAQVSFSFDDNVITGDKGNNGYANNHLAGSKHIEWYTNQDISRANPEVNPFEEGFIDCVAQGFERDNSLQIGGFSITNTSGVTYHYALPAYSFDEYMKSINSSTKQVENGLSYNELKKPEKYAYTWYLTAVTGPDFVDRNSNGLADKGDWGYWVNFEYAKWLGDYKWRNPGEGTNRDLDGDFEFFSSGQKEIYYLDKIITESHVAIFEKSERIDGREVINAKGGGFEPLSFISDPGRQSCIEQCEGYCYQVDCQEPSYTTCRQLCEELPDDVYEYKIPRPTLKLDRIKLFTFESYSKGNIGDQFMLRTMDFEYDYSLAPGTPNSYNSDDPNFIKQGKLTLKSINFLGKGGVSLIPPMSFKYKNLPFGREMTDVWGYYKNDFNPSFRDETNDIIGRLTTPGSALDIDAWSLKTVKTSLGASIEINYESDRYDDVVLGRQQILRVKDVTDVAENQIKLSFWENGINLSDYFQEGETIEADLIGAYENWQYTNWDCGCDKPAQLPSGFDIRAFSAMVTVDDINTSEGYIIISNPNYYNQIKYETKVFSEPVDASDVRYTEPSECSKFDILYCTKTYGENETWPDYFPAGIVSFPEKSRFGGGLRVKSISLLNPAGDGRVTIYEYEGGVTSYEPYEILAPKIHPDYSAIAGSRRTKLYYKRTLLQKLAKQIGISRQLPGPGVMYSKVRVKDKNITNTAQEHMVPNYTQYEFETYQKGMVDVVSSDVNVRGGSNNLYDGVRYDNTYLNKVSLKDFSSRVGNLKRITLYNSLNNEPVSETVNHYLHDNLDGSFNDNITEYEEDLSAKFSNQGLIEQTFTRSRIVLYKKFENKPYLAGSEAQTFFTKEKRHLLATISKLESFPSIPFGQSSTNFKTGGKSSTENLAFDFYSGEPTKVLSKDSYGNRHIATSVPAYKEYGGMGLKIYDKKNKNMLSQVAMQYSFLANADNTPKGLLSASIQTWSDQVPVLNVAHSPRGVWRKQANYQWNGNEGLNNDGTYKYEHFNLHPFNFSDLTLNENWEKTAQITLYDIYSHGLEMSDINGNYSSTKMNPKQTQIISSVSNASYYEAAHSSAEYYAGNLEKEGGVDRGEGNPSVVRSHTGKYSLLVGYGSKGFTYTLEKEKAAFERKYRASVWVYAPGEAETQTELDKIQLYYSVDDVEKKEVHPILHKNKSKSWYLLNIDVSIPGGAEKVNIGCRNNASRGAYFDDFRVHPLDATMTAYVYDPFNGEVNYILDANNFYTRFEYDAMGRLVRTSKEQLNYDFGDGKQSFKPDVVLGETKYNFGKNK